VTTVKEKEAGKVLEEKEIFVKGVMVQVENINDPKIDNLVFYPLKPLSNYVTTTIPTVNSKTIHHT